MKNCGICDRLGYDNLNKVCLGFFCLLNVFLIIRVNIFVIDGSWFYLGVN